MAGRIYLLNDNAELMAMEESLYDSEKLLQRLLADYPDLLAGEQIDSDEPRRWLLVTREMSVINEEGEGARWSLDHLFLDQDAVPTLVEVKRSTNTQIRREVVGQMLDYAANAVRYWPVEEIRSKFESRCADDEQDPEEVLASFLTEEQDIAEYWHRVKTNLQAGRVRMVFVADIIPSELRRVVEFLNEQMDPAEVLAIEVKQFVGRGMKTLVPRVLGQTETARQKKVPSSKRRKQWDELSLLAVLEEEKGNSIRQVAEDLLRFITPLVDCMVWGSGVKEGGVVPTILNGKVKYSVCRIATHGKFVVWFDHLSKLPPFVDVDLRKRLLARINELPEVDFDEGVLSKRAIIPFAKLSTAEAMEKLKATMIWLIETIKAESESEHGPHEAQLTLSSTSSDALGIPSV